MSIRIHLVFPALFLFALPLAASAAASPTDATVDSLLADGRDLLRDHRVDEALSAFERAAELDSGSAECRVWVVRAWIAAGRVEAAMNALDELAEAGASESDLDYLRGLVFSAQAKARLAATGRDQFSRDLFEYSVRLLSRSLASDELRHADAWLTLAESAWHVARLDEAREAVERAVDFVPRGLAEHELLGRIASAQFADARGAGAEREGSAHWHTADAAFRTAIDLSERPATEQARCALADLHAQRASLYARAGRGAEVAQDYETAMSLDPTCVDFASAREALGVEVFARCLARAVQSFEALHGESDARLATLAWWLGRAEFERECWSESEEAFSRALALWPSYTNSWYYVFRCRLELGAREPALQALHAYDHTDSAGLFETLAFDLRANIALLDRLVLWCGDPALHGGTALNREAAFVCDLQAQLEPDEARHWNNVGLFLREHGDRLLARGGSEPVELEALWSRILDAYERALELDPENPNYLNDTAVVLHYYLRRDFDRARALYQRAEGAADRWLEREDLSAAERDLVRTARGDARDNLRRLARYLAKVEHGDDVQPIDVP